jgi:hypothetical protein
MYNAPSSDQIKTINKELSKIFKAVDKLSFEEIGFSENESHYYRDCDISVSEILKVLFGKASTCQKGSIGTIISELSMESSIKKDYTRGAIFYRTQQIDPKKFLDKLLSLIKPEASNDFILCTFDGSSIAMAKNKLIEVKYKKTKCCENMHSSKPMAKIHYLMAENYQTCIGMTTEQHNISERVELIRLAVDAQAKGQKLDIMADRGLYGAMPCSILEQLGHKFSLRLAGELVKKMKDYTFKNNSLMLELNIYRSAIKPYKDIVPNLTEGKVIFRIVRKKGSTTRKAMYIITNDYDMTAEDIFMRYSKRQRIEDNFKYLKSYGGMEKLNFNTGLQMAELIMAALIFYISIIQKVLSRVIETPRPDQKGKQTANRHMAWQLFYIVVKSDNAIKMLIRFLEAILKKTLTIRPGRHHERFILQTIKTKKKVKK